MKATRSVARVTGASSVIGAATAERLATTGYRVYGTSRRGARAGHSSFEMLSLDVTSDESVEAAVSQVIRLDGRVARPKLRYTAGSAASRVRVPCRFSPARRVNGGIRKDLQLDASLLSRTPALATRGDRT